MGLIKKGAEDGLGYSRIAKIYPGFGLKQSGARDVVERIKKNEAVGRKKGSGRKATARAQAAIEAVRQVADENPGSSVGDVMKKTGLKRTTSRNVLKVSLGLKPFTKIKARRAKPENQKKRLDACVKWKGGNGGE